MIKFNKLVASGGCPHCRSVSRVRKKLNRKLPFANRISRDNIKDAKNFNVIRYPIANKLKYKDEEELGTPHLTLGKIKDGQIIEDISIRGEYDKDIMIAFLNGYMNNEFNPGWKGHYEEEMKEEHEEVFGE
jgi:hypothetical protein